MPYAIFSPTDGRIVKIGSSVKEANAAAQGPHYVMAPHGFRIDDTQHYVVADEITARPWAPITCDKTTTAADGEDVARIDGIPEGSTVRVDGAKVDLEGDGFLEVGSDEPGTTHVWIEPPFPARLWEVEITHG